MKKSEKVLLELIDRLELGNTLTSICKSNEMPGLSTVNAWCKNDNKIKERILDARRMGAMTWLDKMQDLLDTEVEPSQVQWNRERLHHARWVASKLVSVFGDKQTVVNEGDNVITVVWKDEEAASDPSTIGKQAALAHASRGSKPKIDQKIDQSDIN